VLFEFAAKHVRNALKRIFYTYYLRDMTMVSIELPLGLLLTIGGIAFGADAWASSSERGLSTPAGTVMLAALPIILGMQMLLAALNQDIANVPDQPFQSRAHR
jgi:uncharacterized membrane protein